MDGNDNMKQEAVKRLLKQEDSTLNRQFEDFAGFYGYKSVLCRPYRRQVKGKVERTIEFVEGRTKEHSDVPLNTKGDALLAGLVYCGHCGSNLVLTTSWDSRDQANRRIRARYRLCRLQYYLHLPMPYKASSRQLPQHR